MASIPLPALHVNPPTDQGEGIQRMVQMMTMLRQQKAQDALLPGQIQQQQQAIQATGLENQQKQQAIKNQQAQTAAMNEWDGKDMSTLPGLMLKHGATADVVMSTKSAITKQLQEMENLSKDQLANQATVNDRLLGHIDAIKGVTDPAQRGTVAQQQAQQIIQAGLHKNLDPQSGQMVQAIAQGQMVPTDDQISIFEKGLTAHNAQIEQAAKAAETREKNAQAGKMETENANLQKFGGMSPAMAESRYLSIQTKLNQGLPISPVDKAFSAGYEKNKLLVPKYNFTLQNSGTTGPSADVAKRFGMTPEAFDQAAEKYVSTGTLPPSGRGGPSLALNKAIMNRGAELHPGTSLAANSAEYKANSDSLKKLQTNFDQVTAFENTAGKNLDVFLNTAKKVVDAGSPWINKPLRSIDASGLGGEDQAAFNAARTTALTEIAKVLNSSNASGVLSDSARHEVEGLIGPGATLQQVMSAANVLKKDMANRHESYQQQIEDIQGRLGSKNSSQQQPAAAPAPAKSGGFDWTKFPKVNP